MTIVNCESKTVWEISIFASKGSDILIRNWENTVLQHECPLDQCTIINETFTALWSMMINAKTQKSMIDSEWTLLGNESWKARDALNEQVIYTLSLIAPISRELLVRNKEKQCKMCKKRRLAYLRRLGISAMIWSVVIEFWWPRLRNISVFAKQIISYLKNCAWYGILRLRNWKVFKSYQDSQTSPSYRR